MSRLILPAFQVGKRALFRAARQLRADPAWLRVMLEHLGHTTGADERRFMIGNATHNLKGGFHVN